MPRYYNKTRGPLSLSLPSGPTVIAAKSFLEISREDAGCAAVTKYVQKGMLVPPKKPSVPPPPMPTVPKTAVPTVDPAPVLEPEKEQLLDVPVTESSENKR